MKALLALCFTFSEPLKKDRAIFFALGGLSMVARHIKSTPPIVLKCVNVASMLRIGAMFYLGTRFEKVYTVTFAFINFVWVPRLLQAQKGARP